jgi:hypothetical protein
VAAGIAAGVCHYLCLLRCKDLRACKCNIQMAQIGTVFSLLCSGPTCSMYISFYKSLVTSWRTDNTCLHTLTDGGLKDQIPL